MGTPFVVAGKLVQGFIDQERVDIVALLIEFIGQLVAGAFLPIGPVARIRSRSRLLRIQQIDGLLDCLPVHAQFLVGFGHQKTHLGDLRGQRDLLEAEVSFGDHSVPVLQLEEGLDQLQADVGLVEVCVGELQDTAEEIGGLVELPGHEIGVGDLRLGQKNQILVG